MSRNKKSFFKALFITLSGLFCVVSAYAETGTFMTEGVVRKIDPDNRKITIKHGEIKNLDMPGMTMVFRLQEGISLDKLVAGDKVLFHVEKIDGAFVITELQGSP
jgi:Cu/Ag efflux protein CusF